MCGGGPDVDDSPLRFQQSEAARARAQEEARQLRIAEGMRQIAAIFEGGEFAPVTNEIEATEVPGEFGKRFPGFTAPDPSTFQRGETQTFEGLQPVLDQRRDALEGFLVPQLEDQFDDARDDLTFSLARSGQLTSSTAGQQRPRGGHHVPAGHAAPEPHRAGLYRHRPRYRGGSAGRREWPYPSPCNPQPARKRDGPRCEDVTMCTDIDIQQLAERAGARSQVQPAPDLSGQARMDQRKDGSFFGQQSITQQDVQGILDFARALEDRQFRGGIVTPMRRVR